MRTTIALSAALGLALTGATAAQTARVPPPSDAVGAPGPSGNAGPVSGHGGSATRSPPNLPGNPGREPVPGSMPGVWIGGSPTGGPPGTGGTAGGIAADSR
ncbi:hypothetical protein [Methylobacterium oryzisoli]|uniref:hypothetical protein n=1 Tax=Methylobacterium oryzisoli TaxID=3385502 RepID=UPI0038913832